MPHPRPLKPSVTLIHTTSGDLVQVQGLENLPTPEADIPLGLRKGEVVQCLRNDGNGVLIARSDGSRVLVPLGSARTVGIRWFPESLDADELQDGLATGQQTGAEAEPRRWTVRMGWPRTGRAEDGSLGGPHMTGPRPR